MYFNSNCQWSSLTSGVLVCVYVEGGGGEGGAVLSIATR